MHLHGLAPARGATATGHGPDTRGRRGDLPTPRPTTPSPSASSLRRHPDAGGGTHTGDRPRDAPRAPASWCTGDLVANGRNERLWQEFFAIERDLLRDAIFIPVIGNHELQNSNAHAIENFRRYVHCPPTSPRPELDYSLVYGNVRLILANAYDDWRRPAMRAWMEEQLADARRQGPDDFLLVITHWGMNSSGPHGENRVLRSAGMAELFRRYRVDLIVAGHDHIYERGVDHGLRYLVTGARARRSATTSGGAVRSSSPPQHHYVRVDAERDRLEFAAVRIDGTVFDRFTIRRARPAPVPYGPPAPEPPPSDVRPARALALDQRVGIGAATVVGDTERAFEVTSRADRVSDLARRGTRRSRREQRPYTRLPLRLPGLASTRRGSSAVTAGLTRSASRASRDVADRHPREAVGLTTCNLLSSQSVPCAGRVVALRGRGERRCCDGAFTGRDAAERHGPGVHVGLRRSGPRAARPLYTQTKGAQWDGARDLPWETERRPRGPSFPDVMVPIWGTPI
ncbi:MAG: metallophosphoesterase [Polyangiales bacterium]